MQSEYGAFGIVGPSSQGYRKGLQWRSEMARGTVKWFNSQKEYGFIQPQGGGKRCVCPYLGCRERELA
jgi:'Cold-shock' DNA-binding domain